MNNFNAPRTNEPVSNSMFYMWRCVICIAHADGMIHEAELTYLRNVFGNMGRRYVLTEEQKQAFEDDIVNPKSLADMLRHINDPSFRAQLIYFGGLLARADGDVHPSEEAVLKKLHADQMSSLDLEQIRKDVHATVQSERFKHEMEINAIRPQDGLSGLLDRFMLMVGIDLMD